jgi:4-amino-4-deoxy-L-arabinose transferase-like glycosyltransferase
MREILQMPAWRITTYLCLAAILTGLIISIVILSSVPPVSRDALTHHLAVPKLYLHHGGIYEIPSLIFSYYPMNLDLIYLLPLYFGYDIIPKFIHSAFAFLTAWLIFGYVKKKSDSVFALTSVLLFLSLPIIVKLSVTAYVDLGLAFFSTAALIYLFKWAEKAFDLKCLIISAVCCGLAMGTKYNGLIVCCLLTLFVPFIYLRNIKCAENSKSNESGTIGRGHSLKSLGYAAIFVIVAIAIFSPWAIRNFVWTGNPVFPLYDHWFHHAKAKPLSETGADSADIDDTRILKSRKPKGIFVFRKIIHKENWWQTALIPVRIFFQGEDDNPRYFDGRLNPYLFFLPIFALLFGRERPRHVKIQQIMLIAFSILYLLIAFFQSDLRMRYVVPIIPPLVILSGLGLHNIFLCLKNQNIWYTRIGWKAAVTAGLAVLIFMNAIYVAGLFHKIEPLSYLSGRVARDYYIEKFRPEYAAMQYANRNLPGTAKIFGLFLGDRGYYLDREIFFGDRLFKEIVTQADSAGQISQALTERQITHLLVRVRLFRQWAFGQFKHEEKLLLMDFFNLHLETVFTKGGYALYQLQN